MSIFNDLRCGFHSGFPWCCIAYFMAVHRHFFFNIKGYYSFYDRYFSLLEASYINCPLCKIRKRAVKVQKCSCMFERLKLKNIPKETKCDILINENQAVYFVHLKDGPVMVVENLGIPRKRILGFFSSDVAGLE